MKYSTSAGRVGGVQGQENAARAHRAEIEHQRIRTLLDLHRHPVTGSDAKGDQRIGIGGRARNQTVIGQRETVRRFDEGGASVANCRTDLGK